MTQEEQIRLYRLMEKLNWFADLVKSGDFRLVGEDVFFSGPFGSQAVASYIGSSAGVSYVELAVNDTFEIGCVPIPKHGKCIPRRNMRGWFRSLPRKTCARLS